uniref:Uncharacterized protein n=1 Tax=Sphaerodactylus townsendi TaxID=933632 RepID=A0ACB8FTY8_9SAUR
MDLQELLADEKLETTQHPVPSDIKAQLRRPKTWVVKSSARQKVLLWSKLGWNIYRHETVYWRTRSSSAGPWQWLLIRSVKHFFRSSSRIGPVCRKNRTANKETCLWQLRRTSKCSAICQADTAHATQLDQLQMEREVLQQEREDLQHRERALQDIEERKRATADQLQRDLAAQAIDLRFEHQRIEADCTRLREALPRADQDQAAHPGLTQCTQAPQMDHCGQIAPRMDQCIPAPRMAHRAEAVQFHMAASCPKKLKPTTLTVKPAPRIPAVKVPKGPKTTRGSSKALAVEDSEFADAEDTDLSVSLTATASKDANDLSKDGVSEVGRCKDAG